MCDSKRSIQMKLRYTSLLGDGNNKIIEINFNKLYDLQFTETKENCVSHVAKRPYKRLKYLCQSDMSEISV